MWLIFNNDFNFGRKLNRYLKTKFVHTFFICSLLHYFQCSFEKCEKSSVTVYALICNLRMFGLFIRLPVIRLVRRTGGGGGPVHGTREARSRGRVFSAVPAGRGRGGDSRGGLGAGGTGAPQVSEVCKGVTLPRCLCWWWFPYNHIFPYKTIYHYQRLVIQHANSKISKCAYV